MAIKKKCLDTYALIEISKGNKNFFNYLEQEPIILDLLLAEFYGILLRNHGESIADYWYSLLETTSMGVAKELLIKAVKFKYEHKKENLSFFDCVGYVYSVENNMDFVTGDKEFKNKESVEFVK